MVLTVSLLFLSLPVLAFCRNNELHSAYQFNVTLHQDRYWLYWSFSKDTQVIRFAVRVRTTGWIGFGLSPNGQMPGSDVVIGWIDESSRYFHDRFAYGRYTPPVDPIQNWYLTAAEEEDGYTVLEFYRNFTTCDDRDLDILFETGHVVYSWNDHKPVVNKISDGSKSYTISRHTSQGSKSINLLGGLPNPPSIPPNHAQSFMIAAHQVKVPVDTTTYWCEAMKLPPALILNKKYIVKFSPHITPGNEPFVHHIVIYVCDGLLQSDLGTGGQCYDSSSVSDRVADCAIPFAVWGVGGNDFVFPGTVAYPIGGVKDSHYAVIQLHYNNPNHVSGIVDSSGIEFTYIDNPREYDAGVMSISHTEKTMVLPPNANDFSVTGLCPPECTRKFLPSDGVRIFANMFHTHKAGSSLIIRHIKQLQCPSGDSPYEELRPIDKNYHYDFNFQQFNHLQEEITVLPGDTLKLECHYNTTKRQKVTMGGISSMEEMCVAAMLYYPRVERAECMSAPTFDQIKVFAEEQVPVGYRNMFDSISGNTSRERIEAAVRMLEWSPQQVKSYQQIVYDKGKQSIRCLPLETGKIITSSVPPVCCPYVSHNSCSNHKVVQCCKRQCQVSEESDSNETNTDVQLLILISLTGAILLFLILVTTFWPQISHQYLR